MPLFYANAHRYMLVCRCILFISKSKQHTVPSFINHFATLSVLTIPTTLLNMVNQQYPCFGRNYVFDASQCLYTHLSFNLPDSKTYPDKSKERSKKVPSQIPSSSAVNSACKNACNSKNLL